MTKTTATALTSLLETAQATLGISDGELCATMGYEQQRTIQMIKQGRMRLPVQQVKALAEALSLDPSTVLRMVLNESSQGLFDLIKGILDPLTLTDAEVNLIRHCRKLANGKDVHPIVFDGKGVVAFVTA